MAVAAPPDASKRSRGRWVVSPTVDILCFGGPIVAAFLIMKATAGIPENEIPLEWWIPMGVLIDVAHVWGTIYRTILDSEATSRNWALLIVAGPGLLAVTLFVNVCFGTHVGWTMLAYYAIYHFAKQPFGILCLYKARCGEHCPREHQWDYWTCIAGAAIPTLINHVGGQREHLGWFFAEEEFLFRLPLWTAAPLYALYVLVPLLWLARFVKRWAVDGAPFNLGKLAIMAIQYIAWFMGSTEHQLTALAFHNLFHGVASMLLVYHVARRRMKTWREASPSTMKWQDRLNEYFLASPARYVLVMMALGITEEVSWDFFVNRDFLPNFGYSPPRWTVTQRAVATSFLMLPQLSHYFLDGFIWKLTLKNPGLREALLQDEMANIQESHVKKE